MGDYSFKPGWAVSLGFVALVALFVSLGLWQLQRAEAKRALMADRAARLREAPVRLSRAATDPEALRYRRVEATGEYDAAHQFLLDNQLHQGQPGYWVLTPLRLPDGAAVLVNRGWVPQGADRRQLPAVELHTTQVQVSGVVERFPRVGFRLAGAEIPAPGWPARVQVAEPGPLAERLGYPILPYQVLLNPAAGEGYVRDWTPPALGPEKNLGYAVQWFLFAAVATILYLWHGFKPRSR